jgi:hypothetical protein
MEGTEAAVGKVASKAATFREGNEKDHGKGNSTAERDPSRTNTNKNSPTLAGRGGVRCNDKQQQHQQQRNTTAPWMRRRLRGIPRRLRDTLYPFQVEGVKYGLAHGGRMLLADEMGVGKTLQALALACCYRQEWPMLVVVPASLRPTWANQIERWVPDITPDQIRVIFGHADRYDETDHKRGVVQVCIVSFEMLKRLKGDIGAWDWGVVIMDEVHSRLRSSSSIDIRAKGGMPPGRPSSEGGVFCCSLATRLTSRRVVFLTGTPSISKPSDLYNQVDALTCGALLGLSSRWPVSHTVRRGKTTEVRAGGKRERQRERDKQREKEREKERERERKRERETDRETGRERERLTLQIYEYAHIHYSHTNTQTHTLPSNRFPPHSPQLPLFLPRPPPPPPSPSSYLVQPIALVNRKHKNFLDDYCYSKV